VNARELQLEQMLKRYNNVKTELDNQQRLELTKINTKVVARPGNASRFSPAKGKRAGSIERA
jgi:hypothetical protein